MNKWWMCIFKHIYLQRGFPVGSMAKSLPAMQVHSMGQEDSLKEAWQPTPVFLPGESHGQRNPSGYSPQGHKESGTTKANESARILTDMSVQVSSVAQSCPTLCDPMNCSTPGLPVHHQLPESTRTHVHWVSAAVQPSHPLSSPSPPAFNLSQHQGPFKLVSSSHQVAKILEFQLQHQSFQWTPRTDLL